MKNPIALIGFMGSGKSAVGRTIAKSLDIPFFDLDDYIESRENMLIREIFEIKGENYFRELEKKYLIQLHEESRKPFVLSTGGGAPCFLDNMMLLKSHYLTVFLSPPIEELKRRLIKNKSKRPLIARISDDEIIPYISIKLAERNPFYSQADLIIRTEENELEHNASYVKTLLENYDAL